MSRRNFSIDLLKLVASQVIVLHHLANYSPMTSSVQQGLDGLFELLKWEGRYVVQIFLVIGGFLSVQSLSRYFDPAQRTGSSPIEVIWQRYLRLGKPYWVAMFVAFGVMLMVELWILQDQLHWGQLLFQLLAHILLLHDVLGVEALSAGVWYVAIDLQLFALTAFTLYTAKALAQKTQIAFHTWGLVLLMGLTLAGLYWFNRNPNIDEWAIYFFGSYGLGMMCHWAIRQERKLFWSALIIGVLALGLWIEWRDRLLVAAFAAAVLLYGEPLRHSLLNNNRKYATNPLRIKFIAWVEKWGDASYSVFLIHYPVILLISSLMIQWDPQSTAADYSAWMLAWSLSLAAGLYLHKKVG